MAKPVTQCSVCGHFRVCKAGKCTTCRQKSKPTTLCIKCGEVKICLFSGRCAACYKREYYLANRDIVIAKVQAYTKLNPEKRRSWGITSHYRTKYGKTLSDLLELHTAQEEQCAICSGTLPPPGSGSGVKLGCHVDHCHKTGEVRGLLCCTCNSLLGKARDSPAILQRAAAYLTRKP
jgi:Recombination endonuclease VII